jgi:hypothetical protein
MPKPLYQPNAAVFQRVVDALAPDVAAAFVATGRLTPAMRSAQQGLHRKALRHNWSEGLPTRIVKHPLCDYGTALAVYWMGRPVYDQAFAALDQVPEWRRPAFRFLRQLEKRLLACDFVSANLQFDPKRDRGPDPSSDYDWTADTSGTPVLRPIPERLHLPSRAGR